MQQITHIAPAVDVFHRNAVDALLEFRQQLVFAKRKIKPRPPKNLQLNRGIPHNGRPRISNSLAEKPLCPGKVAALNKLINARRRLRRSHTRKENKCHRQSNGSVHRR